MMIGPGLGLSLGTPTTGQPSCHSILSIIINLPGWLFIFPANIISCCIPGSAGESVSNHHHHLSRRGSRATILHQHPQQSRDLNNYQNYQENKNVQLPYLVPRRSSCDPENNTNIINNHQESVVTPPMAREGKGKVHLILFFQLKMPV